MQILSSYSVIDSQVHIWAPERPGREWVPDTVPHMAEPLSDARLLDMMQAAGVGGAILVPPAWEGDRVDYCLEAAERHPDRFAVMGRIDLRIPDRQLVRKWLELQHMLGARLTFQGTESTHWLTDGTADWFWPVAEEAQLPVMLNVPYNLAEVGELAARHPNLPLIIDHMGARQVVDDALAKPIDALVALARFPNVNVKLTLVPTFSSAPYPYNNIHFHVEKLVRAYGVRRCFWGSDLTVMFKRSECSYADAVTLFTEHMSFLTQDDLTWIMGRGLAYCLNWQAKMGPPQP